MEQKKKEGICSVLSKMFFTNSAAAAQKQLGKIDETLDTLYKKQGECVAQLKELKENLVLLGDPKNKVDTAGMSRKNMIIHTRKRISILIGQSKHYQKHIDFFCNCKLNLETNAMTKELALHIGGLKREMLRAGAVDVDQINEDIDDIAEINDDLKDVNDRLGDTMGSAWNYEIDEDELNEFLNQDDDDLFCDENAVLVQPKIKEYIAPSASKEETLVVQEIVEEKRTVEPVLDF